MQLRLLELTEDQLADMDVYMGYSLEAGDCYLCDFEHCKVDGRPPCLAIRLPGAAGMWHTNWQSTDEPRRWWSVVGTAPKITVNPSINVGPEVWHGWIRDGELTPETDHRGVR